MELKLVLPVPTSVNSLYVNQYKYNPKTKRSEPTGSRVLGKEGAMTKALIRKAAKAQMKKQDWDYEKSKELYLYVDLTFYFSRKGRDSDNCLKLLQDSLQSVVYDNDSYILCRIQRVLFDTENPRVEAYIHPTTYVGVFDDQVDLNKFENKCKTCKRYNNNCSILVKAKEGRVQEEISKGFMDYSCSKYSALK
jgi:Holliday junction resolvase RusA-like endonuclease